jgi:hypothetical protein
MREYRSLLRELELVTVLNTVEVCGTCLIMQSARKTSQGSCVTDYTKLRTLSSLLSED